jgi:glycosyltransferase involved in cell wall biosynthesis
MLTVALDAEHTRQSAAGIARYAHGLAAALRKLPDIKVTELGGGPVVPRGTFVKRATTLRQDFYWYPWGARRAAAREGADIYHSPLPRGPLNKGRPPFVVTVHDLVAIRFPETSTRWSRLYSAGTFMKVLGAADLILTPSHDTANDLTALAKIDHNRIRVVPNGIDPIFFEWNREPPTLEGPYVLFVGTPEPRKNLNRLIEAMTILRKRGSSEKLVLAGSGGWGAAVTESTNVVQTGRVTDEQLVSLYANASCLAIPSLHEGFGLPVLEAMAAGTPVVASRSGALPEVAGDAAVLVDPLRAESIADGIAAAIADRENLVERGRFQASKFSWARTATLTAAAYRELV